MWVWVWVLAASVLAALLFFLIYRKAKLSLDYWNNQANALTVDGVAVLLGELEATGEAIVERLEAKQREVDQLVKLLDAKIELLQVSLTLKAEQDAPGPSVEVRENPNPAAQAAGRDGGTADQSPVRLGEKQQLVLHWQQQGLTPVEIAQKTELKLDEVRLILNLWPSSK